MKRLLIIVFIPFIIASCSKEGNPKPEVIKRFIYKNLGNKEVDYNQGMQIDLNNDGVKDLIFAATIIEDYLIEKLEFTVYTLNGTQLFNQNSTPKVFDKGEIIPVENTDRFVWTRNNTFLAYRLYTDDPARPEWEGAWNNYQNKYLGVKIKSRDKMYSCWMRISTGGIHSKIILHDYAYSIDPDISIKAGVTE